MIKLFSVLVAMTMVFSLAACGGTPSSGTDTSSEPPVSSSEPTSTPSETPDSSEAPASDAPSSQPEEATEEGETLVAYFSWSGNTQQMAEIIARETGADLFEIATVTPYTDDYNELLDIAQQEQNWWSDAPMAVYTFLESYDFTGKTLIPFNTSASGGFGRSLTGIEESAAGATILEGLDLTEGELEDAENRVATWLDSLGLNG